MTRIALGADHGGVELKDILAGYLATDFPDYDVRDMGTFGNDSVDYPDYAAKICEGILSRKIDLGVLVCGTGIGISMKANRYKGIRAALVHDDFTAEMAKAHNNANVLCFGGRVTAPNDATRLLRIWLRTRFEGDRHQRRLEMLDY